MAVKRLAHYAKSWRRAALATAIAVAAHALSACAESDGPASDDARVTSTQIFPGEVRTLRITGVRGGIDVEGSLTPPCGPYDWFTSLGSGNGAADIEFGMRGQDLGCTDDSPEPFSYRSEIRGLVPGPRRFVVRHGWSSATDPSSTTVFDDTVTVR
jgi:hypothetical protein